MHQPHKALLRLICLGWAGLTVLPVTAQTLRIQPSVAASLLATNNVELADKANAKTDYVLTVSPRLGLTGQGAGYQLEGALGLNSVTYLNSSDSNKILPTANIGGTLRVVDQLLYINSRLDVDTLAVDPLMTAAEGGTAITNRQNIYRYRLSPYIDRRLTEHTRLTARSDNTWVRTENLSSTAGSNTHAYVQNDVVRLESEPLPLGFQIEGTRLDSRLDQGGVRSDVLGDAARVVVLYALDPQFQVAVRGGRERFEYSTTQYTDSIRGYGLRWLPSERTNLEAMYEKRFFGNGWQANFVHRGPSLALSANLTRQITTYAQSLATLPTAGATSTLLDAAYKNTVTDDLKRAELIKGMIAKYNLPENLSGPLQIQSNRPQIQQGGSVTLALLGVRHTLSLRLFQQRMEDLPTDDPVLALFTSAVLQRGLTLGFNRRLDPQTTLDSAYTYVRAEDLILSGETVTQSFRLGLNHKVSERTLTNAGLRYTRATSTRSGIAPLITESAAYVGLSQSF